jgi:hypothetical protein
MEIAQTAFSGGSRQQQINPDPPLFSMSSQVTLTDADAAEDWQLFS